jgi:hypothetical protein
LTPGKEAVKFSIGRFSHISVLVAASAKGPGLLIFSSIDLLFKTASHSFKKDRIFLKCAQHHSFSNGNSSLKL